MKLIKATLMVMWMLMFPILCSAQEETSGTLPKWRIGDRWELETTLYSRGWMADYSDPKVEQRKNEEKIYGKYVVKVDVSGGVPYKGTDCWQLDFSTDGQAPKGIQNVIYRILVSKQDGAMKNITLLSKQAIGDPRLETVDGITYLNHSPYGFPIEMIPWKRDASDNKASHVRTSVHLKTTTIDSDRWIELGVKQFSNQPPSILRQKWDSKHEWWLEYEKYNLGHKELIAKLRTISNEKTTK